MVFHVQPLGDANKRSVLLPTTEIAVAAALLTTQPLPS